MKNHNRIPFIVLLLTSVIVCGSFATDKNVQITTKDLSHHSTISDCWIAIQNKVYDVSQYISKHPAQESAITNYCGKPADLGWETKDKGKPHSKAAEKLLNRYLIGSLAQ